MSVWEAAHFYVKMASAGLLTSGIKDRKKRNEVADEMKM